MIPILLPPPDFGQHFISGGLITSNPYFYLLYCKHFSPNLLLGVIFYLAEVSVGSRGLIYPIAHYKRKQSHVNYIYYRLSSTLIQNDGYKNRQMTANPRGTVTFIELTLAQINENTTWIANMASSFKIIYQLAFMMVVREKVCFQKHCIFHICLT